MTWKNASSISIIGFKLSLIVLIFIALAYLNIIPHNFEIFGILLIFIVPCAIIGAICSLIGLGIDIVKKRELRASIAGVACCAIYVGLFWWDIWFPTHRPLSYEERRVNSGEVVIIETEDTVLITADSTRVPAKTIVSMSE